MTKLMPKSNPARCVLLLLTKIIWKNAGTFWGIREETAVALFAILEYYQRTFYVLFPSVSSILSLEFMESIMLVCNYRQGVSVCMCVCLVECVCVIAVLVPCKLHWALCCLTSTLHIPAIHFFENVKIILTQVSLQIKRNLTKICGEPEQSG